MPSKNDYTKGLSYVAQTPSFLKNFGKPPASPEAGPSGGRAALPERPSDGRWAGGSDDEDEDDEWGTRFGGGGDEGPQVVVLKEGRHLTAEQVKRERKRGERSFNLALTGSRRKSFSIPSADCIARQTAHCCSSLTASKRPYQHVNQRFQIQAEHI